MNDEIAIQQTINLYTEGATRSDYEQVLATFLPDAFWGCPELGTEHQGHDAIQAAMVAWTSQFDHFVQTNAPAVISITGETATARSVMRECWKFADRDEALEVYGIYEDELMRTNDGWKFARRSFTHAHFLRFSLQPGPVRG
jgi:ketosteroid isomerase-like protein